MAKFTHIMLMLVISIMTLACTGKKATENKEPKHNTLTKVEKEAGWELLFDGETFYYENGDVQL